jgi:hypothetical protein
LKEILNDAKARNEIRGLEQSSFSYDLPEDGLARISGNLHTNNRFLLTESAVKPWISDDQIKMDSGFSDFFLTKMGLEAAFAHQRHLGRLRRWLLSPPGLGGQVPGQQLGHGSAACWWKNLHISESKRRGFLNKGIASEHVNDVLLVH